MKLWIVGKSYGGAAWSFMGLFEHWEAALLACKSEAYFVAPFVLNRVLPDGFEGAVGQFFPRRPIDATNRPPKEVSDGLINAVPAIGARPA